MKTVRVLSDEDTVYSSYFLTCPTACMQIDCKYLLNQIDLRTLAHLLVALPRTLTG